MVPELPSMGGEREPGDRVVAKARSPRRLTGKRWLWIGVAVVVLVAVGAGVAWLTGDVNSPVDGLSEPPLIKADGEPVKVRPERPGGLKVPNRDKLVYRRLEGLAEPPVVEKLLPEPEEPLPPPRPKPVPQAESADTTAPEPAIPSGTAGDMVEPPTTAMQDTPSIPALPPAKAAAEAETEPLSAEINESADTTAASSSTYQIQLIAVRKREQAEGMWKKLRGKYPDVFANLEPDIGRAELGNKGVLYRLRAGPIDSEAKARSLCADLGRRKVDCLVVRTGG